ncbi:GAF domain-containing protein [Rhodoflexus sp.]
MNFLDRLFFAQKVALVVSAVLAGFLLIAAFSFYAFQRNLILESSKDRLASHAEDLHYMFLIYHQEQQRRTSRIQEAALNFLKLNTQATDENLTVIATNIADNNQIEIIFRPYQLRELYKLIVGQGMSLQAFQKIDGGYINITNEFAGLNVDKYVFIPNSIAPFTYEADTQIKETIRFDSLDVVMVRYIPCRLGLTDYGYLKLEIKADFSGLYKLLREKKYYTTGYPYVINNEGLVIFHPDKELLGINMLGLTEENSAFFEYMRSTRIGSREVVVGDPQQVIKSHFFRYVEPYQIFLVIVVSKSEIIDQLLAEIIQFIALVFSLLVAINVIISYNFVNRLLAPVKQILGALNQMSKGNFQTLAHTERSDEVGDLIRSLNKAVMGLENATSFATHIGQQQYDTSFEPLSNEDKLGNALLSMRDALRKNAEQDAERRVISEAVTNFSDLIRKAGADLHGLCQQTLSELIRFLNAQQGCLYLAEEDPASGQIRLISVATFADGRRKFKQDSTAPGENLVGQVYLEKQSMRLSNLPPDYFVIASGLGSIPPTHLMIVPIKQNDVVVGIIEIASVELLTDKQQEFVERIAEILAGSVISAQNSERMRRMLEESQILAENLRSQEEEMRQNLEELQATQEEMARRERATRIN